MALYHSQTGHQVINNVYMITGYTGAVVYASASYAEVRMYTNTNLKLDFEVTKNLQNGAEWPLASNPFFVCNTCKIVSSSPSSSSLCSHGITVGILMMASWFKHQVCFADLVM